MFLGDPSHNICTEEIQKIILKEKSAKHDFLIIFTLLFSIISKLLNQETITLHVKNVVF